MLMIFLILIIGSIFLLGKQKNLKGAFVVPVKPQISLANWLSRSYQKEAENYTSDNFLLAGELIRTHNQWDYSLYKNINIKKVVEGKNGQLFEQVYIDGLLGEKSQDKKDFLDQKKNSIVRLHEENRNRNHDLVFIIMPSKAFFKKDDIPDIESKDIPNDHIYDYFNSFAKKHDLNIIDFHDYFMKVRKEIEYPIFTKQGIHISEFAESIVLDSLLKFIEDRKGEDLFTYHFSKVEETTTPRRRDYDIGESLNLVYPISGDERLGYRHLVLDDINYEKRPNILVIGDSFWWGLYPIVNNLGLFGKHEFWYRNHNIFPAIDGHLRQSNEQTCLHSLEKFDMTFMVVNSNDVEWSGWGYFKNTVKALKGDNSVIDIKKLDQLIKEIYNNPKLLESIKVKANERNISLDSMVYLDAKWLYENR